MLRCGLPSGICRSWFLAGCWEASILTTSAEVKPEDETDDIATNIERIHKLDAPGGNPAWEEFSALRKRWREAIGLEYSVSFYSYAAVIAGGEDAPADASGQLILQGVWEPGKRWSENPIGLYFRFRDRRGIGGDSPATMGSGIGTLWGVADGFSDSGFQVPDFYLQHTFTKPGIELRYGQMTIDSQFDSNALGGSKQSFLSQAFSTNPSIPFPSYGAGLTLAKKFENGLSLVVGACNVQGTQVDGQEVGFKFNSSDFFETAQLGYDFKARQDSAARLQLMLWHSDGESATNQGEGQGFSLTYEQEINGPSLRAFGRLSASDGGITTVDLMATAGMAVAVRERDLAGVAIGLGRGSDDGEPVQTVVEGFYRWQALDWIRISPDFQILAGQGYVATPGLRWLVGLRAGIDF